MPMRPDRQPDRQPRRRQPDRQPDRQLGRRQPRRRQPGPRAAVRVATAVLAVGLAVAAAASGCAQTPGESAAANATATASPRPPEVPEPGDHALVLDWAGKPRGYELHAPPDYRPDAKMPLVVVLHYLGATPAIMREMTQFDAKADEEGFLVAYPAGLGRTWTSPEDVGFVRAVVEHLVDTWHVDADRVYATGISVGAQMSYKLAVEASDLFAAIAPVSGGFSGSRALNDDGYKPTSPVSVVSFIGNSDGSANGYLSGLRAWYRKVGCTPGERAWFDAGRIVTLSTATCADGSAVDSYVINKMFHSWPGGSDAGIGDPRPPINAVDVMWSFFANHPRRT